MAQVGAVVGVNSSVGRFGLAVHKLKTESVFFFCREMAFNRLYTRRGISSILNLKPFTKMSVVGYSNALKKT